MRPDGSSWQENNSILRRNNRRPRSSDTVRRIVVVRRSTPGGARRPRPRASASFRARPTDGLRTRCSRAHARDRARRAWPESRPTVARTGARGERDAYRRTALFPTPTKSAWNSSPAASASMTALAARRDSHAKAMVFASSPAPCNAPGAGGARGAAAAMAARSAASGASRVKPREKRIELGARLILGLQIVVQPRLSLRHP